MSYVIQRADGSYGRTRYATEERAIRALARRQDVGAAVV
jgi:hypothetical protein